MTLQPAYELLRKPQTLIAWIACKRSNAARNKRIRQTSSPKLQTSHYSNTILKHLAPLWATSTHRWITIITATNTSPSDTQLHIRNTEAIIARLPHRRQHDSDSQLRTCIDTLRTTLLLPANTPHRKLPKGPTLCSTLVHPTRHAYITQIDIPLHAST